MSRMPLLTRRLPSLSINALLQQLTGLRAQQ
jgi:hypothetical protein